MKRKIFSILFALVLILSFSLVTAVPVAAQDSAVFTAITNTADRLVALQSTETLGTLDPPDFGWDWVVTDLTQHSGNPSGSNLYGVTALGLIDAYQETGNTAYSTAAEKTADHLKTLSRATDSTVRFQSFDYRFLVEFSALSADPSYEAHALSEWNWVKANVASYYADGNQDTIYNFWAQLGHGLAAWQAGDTGLATLAMGDTSWASNMAGVLAGHLGEITASDINRFIGWGHALEFLNAVDSTTYATEITSLISNLTVSQNADGSWGTGENTEGYAQDAAYAIMGLAAVGEREAAEKGAAWLVANQGYDAIEGGWNNSTDNKEYSETDSEALQALVAVPAGIVALWHLDEGTGTTASDSSGNGYNGILYNFGPTPPPYWVPGMFGNALKFDGTDDYVEVAHPIAANSAITMEAWVKVSSPLSTDAEVISKWDGAGNGVIHFEIAPNLRVRMCLRWGTGLYETIVDFYSTEALPANAWVHVAEVWDGTTATIYFNGVAKGSQSGSGVIRHNTDMKYWVGSAYGTMRFFNGLIDEVRIWDVALTAAQVAQSASLGDLEFTKELESAVDESDNAVNPGEIPLGENITFTMEIEVDNTLTGLTLNDVAVKDRLGAELEISSLSTTAGTASYTTKGKSAKVFIDWDVGTTLGAATATLGIEANTDYNPGGGKKAPHQEYSNPGDYELNSGATLTFSVTIASEEIWLVLTTDPISVIVVGTEED